MIVLLGAFLMPGVAHAASVAPVSVHRLSGNVYEYYWVVSTGRDVHHRIGVHRVVQVRNGKPLVATNGVFLLGGDGDNFHEAFRGGTSARESIAVYLASRGLDVWGIDLGWTLVPAKTTSFSFMRGWGLQRDVNDLEKGLSFARSVRAQTGSSHRRLPLLGWSRGGWIGYALLNEESQKPLAQRQVRAFIPVDTMFKTNDNRARGIACANEFFDNRDLTAGRYYRSYQDEVQLGRLALTAANQPAKQPAGQTNLQVSLSSGAAPFQTIVDITPYFHAVGGVFSNGDITQIPSGLAYTDVSRWNHELTMTPLFESLTMIRDAWAISCDQQGPTPFDNHLKNITVPVLYVGAGGGFGPLGLYSLTLLGSKDISSHIMSFYPPARAALDFGHCDPFFARDAQQLVWKPIYTWLSRHAR
jgi:hypothetical protein